MREAATTIGAILCALAAVVLVGVTALGVLGAGLAGDLNFRFLAVVLVSLALSFGLWVLSFRLGFGRWPKFRH